MVAGDGVHVGVAVSVVKAVRDLLVDVHVGGGQTGLHAGGAGVAHQGGDLLEGQTQLASVSGEVGQRERGVVVVQTRVQNGHHGTGTVVGEVGAVEDTRVVDVHGVLNQLVANGLSLLGLVDLTDDGGASIAHGLGDSLEVTGLDDDLKAAHDVVVVLAQGVLQLGLVQICEKGLLLGGDAVANRGGLIGQDVLGEGHPGGSTGVLLQEGLLLDLYDDRYIVGLLDGLRELVHNGVVQILVTVGDDRALEGTNTTAVDRASGDEPGHHSSGSRQHHDSRQDHRYKTNPGQFSRSFCDHVEYLSGYEFSIDKKAHE